MFSYSPSPASASPVINCLRRFRLALVLVLSLGFAGVASAQLSNIQYTTSVSGGQVTIIGFSATGTGPLVIPATINSMPVVGIGNSELGMGAFYNVTNITSVTIPDSVTTILDYVFENSSMTSVSIGAGATTIGPNAFADCYNLTSISVSASNPDFSSLNKVMFNKNQTTLVQFPTGATGSYTIPSTVTSIAAPAFQNCPNLTSVTIPTSVTTIAANQFNFCTALTSMLIPGSITSIGANAFQGCTALASVQIPNTVTSIGASAFAQTGLTSVTIPNGVLTMGVTAFEDCIKLTSVTVGNGLGTLPADTFNGSTQLSSVTILDGVTGIGSSAFLGCTSLPSITFPASITSIGDDAFYNCGALLSAHFQGNAPTLGSGVFTNCASGFTIYYTNTATGFTSPTWMGYPASQLSPPVITSANTATGTYGVPFSGYTVTATNSPTSFSALGLPTGLTLNSTTGAITGTPKSASSFVVRLTASNSNGSSPAFTLNFTINPTTATVTMSSATFVYNGKGHALTAKTVPSGLPVLITYDGSTTPPSAVGTHSVTASINSPDYTGSATATLTITGIKPIVTTLPANPVTASGATLQGSVNPNSTDTSAYFQWGPTTTYGTTTSPQDLGSGEAVVGFSSAITITPQLVPSVIHYRALASNGIGGLIVGADKVVTFPPKPQYNPATSPTAVLSATGAEVSWSVNPDGAATEVYFQYGLTTNYGSNTPEVSLGSGKSPVNFFIVFPSLLPNTLYHYQLVMTGAAGTYYGPDETFTTLGFDTTVVAKTGDPVSVVGVGAFRATNYLTFGPPAVNSHDGAAFVSTVQGANGVSAVNDIGIWANDENASTLTLIAQIDTIAPGTGPSPTTGGNFLTLSDPVYNDAGELALRATLKVQAGEVTSANATGIWTTGAGSLHLVARQGFPAPNTSGDFSTFTALGLTESAGPIFYATIAGTGITGTNNAGIWEGSTANNLLLRTSQTVSGETISALSFLPTELYVNGQTRSYNAQGDIACHATFLGGKSGIVTVVGGAATAPVITTGSAAAIAGATYATLGNPSINNSDHLAFAATLTTGTGGVTSANNAGIWADEGSATPDLIARIGSAAPGTPASFLTLSDPVYNNNDAVGFRATLKVVTGQATSATATGLWASDGTPGSLQLVARQGTQAPGCPAGATFSTFTELALPDQGGAANKGGLVFVGTLNISSTAGVTSTNNTGVWAVDTNGALQLVARTGDVLNIASTGTPVYKLVTGLTVLSSPAYVSGNTRSVAQSNGDLVYLATFSDKTQAIFNVVFP